MGGGGGERRAQCGGNTLTSGKSNNYVLTADKVREISVFFFLLT